MYSDIPEMKQIVDHASKHDNDQNKGISCH